MTVSKKSVVNETEKVRPPAGATSEIAPDSTGRLFFSNYDENENPDELIKSKGEGLKLYQRMDSDPRVWGATIRLKAKILGPDIEVNPASEDERDQEIAEFVRLNIESTDREFKLIAWDLLDFLSIGFSLGELLLDTDGANWFLKDIKVKDPEAFSLQQDKFKNVTGIKERGMWTTDGRVFDPAKFVRISWMPRYNCPYGRAQYRAAWYYHNALKKLWKFRLMHTERFGTGWIEGEYPLEAGKTERDTFKNALKAMMSSSILTRRPGYTVTMHPGVDDGGAFSSTMHDLERNISIAVMASHLQMEEGRSGSLGSGNATSEHSKGEDLIVDLGQQALMCGLQDQFVMPLVDWNFGRQERYPFLAWKTEEIKSYEEIAADRLRMEMLKEANELGLDVAKQTVREEFDIPSPEPEQELIERSVAAPNPFGGGGPGPGPALGAPTPNFEDEQGRKYAEEEDEAVEDAARLEAVGRARYFEHFDRYVKALEEDVKKKTQRPSSRRTQSRRRRPCT